ncbi:hypothetical protein LINPERPRIM_LOCUS22109 [Linum perenne]
MVASSGIPENHHYYYFLLVLVSFGITGVDALNVGVQATDHPDVTLSKECSRKCESESCFVSKVWKILWVAV